MLPVATAKDGRSPIEFCATAYPAAYGPSTLRTFVVNEQNDIRVKDLKGSPATAFPSREDRSWNHPIDPHSRPPEPGSGPGTFAEADRLWAVRAGFEGDLDHHQGFDRQKGRWAEMREILGLGDSRWAAFKSTHETLLERARRLEFEKAEIRKEGGMTVITIPVFPQEGLALRTEWTRELESIVTPTQKNDLFIEKLFPLGLGQHAVTITLTKVGDLVRVEERHTLSGGKEVTITDLSDPKRLPPSCRHFIR
jgi:hypothetical protein